MGLFGSEETRRIDLPDGEWIEIKAVYTTGDRAYVMDRGYQITAETTGRQGAEVQGRALMGALGLALLERMIVGWSAPEDVTPENVHRLPEYVADRVRQEIDRLNPALSDAERPLSSDGSGPRSARASRGRRS